MHMRPMKLSIAPLLAVVAVMGSACMDLDVTNSNTPDEDAVFNNPLNLEAAIGSTFHVFWGVAQGARTNAVYPAAQLAALGEDITSADAEVHAVTQEPRVELDNKDAGGWTNRKPWYDLNEAMATARDALQAIDRGVKIGLNSEDTPRASVFAKMMLGLGHVYLGLLFDQAFITDENTNPETYNYEFSPYPQVIAHGIKLLEEAITEARAAPTNFTLPTSWINGQTVTRDDLVRVMYSYIVRALVYAPRGPTERAAVDWNRVLTLLPQGITKDFQVQADLAITSTHSSYLQRTQLQTNARIDNHLLGPADTSGAYQTWLATPNEQKQQVQFVTPDRRIHGAGGPTTRGTYFERLATQTMTSARGTYMHSRYRGVRYGTTYYQTGIIKTMTVQEMNFIRAEALFRLDRRAEAAAILNPSRVAAGLRPVDENGPPAGRDCVPRKASGACGDLWDALMYEKRIELNGVEAIIPFADWRGWGRMLKGSLIQFPVHGRELETLGKPYYTFGGSLPGSAP